MCGDDEGDLLRDGSKLVTLRLNPVSKGNGKNDVYGRSEESDGRTGVGLCIDDSLTSGVHVEDGELVTIGTAANSESYSDAMRLMSVTTSMTPSCTLVHACGTSGCFTGSPLFASLVKESEGKRVVTGMSVAAASTGVAVTLTEESGTGVIGSLLLA